MPVSNCDGVEPKDGQLSLTNDAQFQYSTKPVSNNNNKCQINRNQVKGDNLDCSTTVLIKCNAVNIQKGTPPPQQPRKTITSIASMTGRGAEPTLGMTTDTAGDPRPSPAVTALPSSAVTPTSLASHNGTNEAGSGSRGSNDSSSSSGSFPLAAIIGAAVGGVVVLIGIVLCIVCLRRKRRRQMRGRDKYVVQVNDEKERGRGARNDDREERGLNGEKPMKISSPNGLGGRNENGLEDRQSRKGGMTATAARGRKGDHEEEEEVGAAAATGVGASAGAAVGMTGQPRPPPGAFEAAVQREREAREREEREARENQQSRHHSYENKRGYQGRGNEEKSSYHAPRQQGRSHSRQHSSSKDGYGSGEDEGGQGGYLTIDMVEHTMRDKNASSTSIGGSTMVSYDQNPHPDEQKQQKQQQYLHPNHYQDHHRPTHRGPSPSLSRSTSGSGTRSGYGSRSPTPNSIPPRNESRVSDHSNHAYGRPGAPSFQGQQQPMVAPLVYKPKSTYVSSNGNGSSQQQQQKRIPKPRKKPPPQNYQKQEYQEDQDDAQNQQPRRQLGRQDSLYYQQYIDLIPVEDTPKIPHATLALSTSPSSVSKGKQRKREEEYGYDDEADREYLRMHQGATNSARHPGHHKYGDDVDEGEIRYV